jgi:N-sulfoglucosamine sulfohydrolase
MKRATAITALGVTALMACGVTHAAAEKLPPPNILWITSEDNNVDWVGCYGNEFADTPNIDQLAVEGFQYMNVFASAPVCAPSRSTWITGINAVSTGTHPMRSRYDIPHDKIKYYPDLMKENGYSVVNPGKTDYNIGGRDDKECWGDPRVLHWGGLRQKKHQPFFAVKNFQESHESKAFGDVENTQHNPADVKLWKYHPDIPDIRKNYAHYHDAMKKMDALVGKELAQLEKFGLADSTIVIYCSDHGGVMPRSKRFLFESGLHCPLIIRIPEKYKEWWPENKKPGSKIDRLVSYVDMPKTWLSLTSSKIPDSMQGTIFLGPDMETEPEYCFSFRGRMDGRFDNVRSVTDGRYLYLKNYMPYTPWMTHLNYMWQMKATQAWEAYVDAGKASEIESKFFRPREYAEEFYDLKKDRDNVNNLIDNPEYEETISKMRVALGRWQEEIFDTGLLPESERLKRAKENNTTIYEMVRNPKLYNVSDLMNAANLALEKNPSNLPKLHKMLSAPDCGVRYWAAIGCLMLDDNSPEINKAMQDESHTVRAVAAWTAVKYGNKEEGLNCLEAMLAENSYAKLRILNILDWMGEDAKPLIAKLDSFNLKEKWTGGKTLSQYCGTLIDNLKKKYL